MANTSPDGIFSPDSTDDFDYIVDMAAMASSVQDALDNVHSATDGINTTLTNRIPPTVHVFTTGGTWNRPANMRACKVEVVGGGGGGGGAPTSAAGTSSLGGGGGGGEYAFATFSAATAGSSKTVTIGAGGSGGAAGVNNGTAGGTTSFGSLITAVGGGGGASSAAATAISNAGGAGGTGGTGSTLAVPGATGQRAIVSGGDVVINLGQGGQSRFGNGGVPGTSALSTVGVSGTGYGAGGSGALNRTASGSTPRAGGNGTSGVVIVTEYY